MYLKYEYPYATVGIACVLYLYCHMHSIYVIYYTQKPKINLSSVKNPSVPVPYQGTYPATYD